MTQHMQPQVEKGLWVEVEHDHTEWIPADIVGPLGLKKGERVRLAYLNEELARQILDQLSSYIESRPERVTEVALVHGWGARMSAPGYLDATNWTVFETEADAKRYLREEYEAGEPREASELSMNELVDIVEHVQAILWGDPPDPNHEWEADDLDRIAEHMQRYGLAPEDF
jgi:hypothetical protein